MRATIGILLGAVAAVLLLATPAAARRPVEPLELLGMAAEWDLSTGMDCPEGAISTVDERWGAVRDSCRGGLMVVRRADGTRWRKVQGSTGASACVDALTLVPEAIARDLAGCGESPKRRGGTEEERAAVSADVLRGRDPSCIALKVSRVDERFATFTLEDSDRCLSGSFVVSRESGRWQTVAQVQFDRFMCRTAGVPEQVMRSLADDCAVPRTPAIACHSAKGSVRRVKPRACDTYNEGVRNRARPPRLVGMRWSGWGGPRVTGRGYAPHSRARANDRHLPVRIELSGLSTRLCGEVQPLYTSVRIVNARSRITVGGTAFTVPAGSATVKLGRPVSC